MQSSKRSRRIGYPHIVSTLALFVALGGGAYAAATIDSGDVKNNSLTSKDLKNNKAVKSKDVADGSLGAADLGDGSVGSGEVQDGSLGAADVADDSLGGSDVDESSFGQVPTAAKSDTTGSVIPIFARVQPSTGGATDVTLLSHGPFTVKARCNIQNAQQNSIALEATTTENDSVASGRNFGGGTNDPDFDSSEVFEQFGYQESGTPPAPAASAPVTAFLAAPSGSTVSVSVSVATRVLSDDPAGRAPCLVDGFAVVG